MRISLLPSGLRVGLSSFNVHAAFDPTDVGVIQPPHDSSSWSQRKGHFLLVVRFVFDVNLQFGAEKQKSSETLERGGGGGGGGDYGERFAPYHPILPLSALDPSIVSFVQSAVVTRCRAPPPPTRHGLMVTSGSATRRSSNPVTD